MPSHSTPQKDGRQSPNFSLLTPVLSNDAAQRKASARAFMNASPMGSWCCQNCSTENEISLSLEGFDSIVCNHCGNEKQEEDRVWAIAAVDVPFNETYDEDEIRKQISIRAKNTSVFDQGREEEKGVKTTPVPMVPDAEAAAAAVVLDAQTDYDISKSPPVELVSSEKPMPVVVSTIGSKSPMEVHFATSQAHGDVNSTHKEHGSGSRHEKASLHAQPKMNDKRNEVEMKQAKNVKQAKSISKAEVKSEVMVNATELAALRKAAMEYRKIQNNSHRDDIDIMKSSPSKKSQEREAIVPGQSKRGRHLDDNDLYKKSTSKQHHHRSKSRSPARSDLFETSSSLPSYSSAVASIETSVKKKGSKKDQATSPLKQKTGSKNHHHDTSSSSTPPKRAPRNIQSRYATSSSGGNESLLAPKQVETSKVEPQKGNKSHDDELQIIWDKLEDFSKKFGVKRTFEIFKISRDNHQSGIVSSLDLLHGLDCIGASDIVKSNSSTLTKFMKQFALNRNGLIKCQSLASKIRSLHQQQVESPNSVFLGSVQEDQAYITKDGGILLARDDASVEDDDDDKMRDDFDERSLDRRMSQTSDLDSNFSISHHNPTNLEHDRNPTMKDDDHRDFDQASNGLAIEDDQGSDNESFYSAHSIQSTLTNSTRGEKEKDDKSSSEWTADKVWLKIKEFSWREGGLLVKKLFKELDTEQDGLVDEKRFKKALIEMRIPVSQLHPFVISQVMKRAGFAPDSVLSYREFLVELKKASYSSLDTRHAMLKPPKKPHAPPQQSQRQSHQIVSKTKPYQEVASREDISSDSLFDKLSMLEKSKGMSEAAAATAAATTGDGDGAHKPNRNQNQKPLQSIHIQPPKPSSQNSASLTKQQQLKHIRKHDGHSGGGGGAQNKAVENMWEVFKKWCCEDSGLKAMDKFREHDTGNSGILTIVHFENLLNDIALFSDVTKKYTSSSDNETSNHSKKSQLNILNHLKKEWTFGLFTAAHLVMNKKSTVESVKEALYSTQYDKQNHSKMSLKLNYDLFLNTLNTARNPHSPLKLMEATMAREKVEKEAERQKERALVMEAMAKKHREAQQQQQQQFEMNVEEKGEEDEEQFIAEESNQGEAIHHQQRQQQQQQRSLVSSPPPASPADTVAPHSSSPTLSNKSYKSDISQNSIRMLEAIAAEAENAAKALTLLQPEDLLTLEEKEKKRVDRDRRSSGESRRGSSDRNQENQKKTLKKEKLFIPRPRDIRKKSDTAVTSIDGVVKAELLRFNSDIKFDNDDDEDDNDDTRSVRSDASRLSEAAVTIRLQRPKLARRVPQHQLLQQHKEGKFSSNDSSNVSKKVRSASLDGSSTLATRKANMKSLVKQRKRLSAFNDNGNNDNTDDEGEEVQDEPSNNFMKSKKQDRVRSVSLDRGGSSAGDMLRAHAEAVGGMRGWAHRGAFSLHQPWKPPPLPEFLSSPISKSTTLPQSIESVGGENNHENYPEQRKYQSITAATTAATVEPLVFDKSDNKLLELHLTLHRNGQKDSKYFSLLHLLKQDISPAEISPNEKTGDKRLPPSKSFLPGPIPRNGFGDSFLAEDSDLPKQMSSHSMNSSSKRFDSLSEFTKHRQPQSSIRHDRSRKSVSMSRFEEQQSMEIKEAEARLAELQKKYARRSDGGGKEELGQVSYDVFSQNARVDLQDMTRSHHGSRVSSSDSIKSNTYEQLRSTMNYSWELPPPTAAASSRRMHRREERSQSLDRTARYSSHLSHVPSYGMSQPQSRSRSNSVDRGTSHHMSHVPSYGMSQPQSRSRSNSVDRGTSHHVSYVPSTYENIRRGHTSTYESQTVAHPLVTSSNNARPQQHQPILARSSSLDSFEESEKGSPNKSSNRKLNISAQYDSNNIPQRKKYDWKQDFQKKIQENQNQKQQNGGYNLDPRSTMLRNSGRSSNSHANYNNKGDGDGGGEMNVGKKKGATSNVLLVPLTPTKTRPPTPIGMKTQAGMAHFTFNTTAGQATFDHLKHNAMNGASSANVVPPDNFYEPNRNYSGDSVGRRSLPLSPSYTV